MKNHQELKNQAIEWEKIFAHDTLDCDSFLKFNGEERNKPIRKQVKSWLIFTMKKLYRW